MNGLTMRVTNEVMVYCYIVMKKKKRERAACKSCVIRIALADKPFVSGLPKLNVLKKRNNVTIPRQPAWLSHLYRYVLTL